MLKNYILVALRNLLRHKVFSIINILGLAIGIAASILIALWVIDEYSYDRFNEKHDRIYRVERDIFYQGQRFEAPVTGAVYATTIKKNYPEVEDFARIYPIELNVEDRFNSNHEERIIFTDVGFFNVFTYKLKSGNPETALKEPNSIILSQPAAKRYFGDENPMGKTLRVEWDTAYINFKVTGLLDELPHNSHFHFEVLASFATLEDAIPDQLSSWLNNYLFSYILLHEGTDIKTLEEKVQKVSRDYILPEYMQFFKVDDIDEIDASIKLVLRPLTDIHLKTDLMWEIEPQGDLTIVYIFTIVSILILFIAGFNFMNLSTAMAGARSLEVGIRKTVGAHKQQLIAQFIGESIIISFIALILGVLFIEIALPSFNLLTNKDLSLSLFGNPVNFLILMVCIIFLGVISGIYPAFYMSSFRPILVLKGKSMLKGRKIGLRQVLVVLQFTITITLIIGTITAFRQLTFLQNKDLGYNKDNILVVTVENATVREHMESFKAELRALPSVTHVTSSAKVPSARNYSDSGWESELTDEVMVCRYFGIDYDFLNTYDIEMAAGRAFSKEFGSDDDNKFIVNEAAAHRMGVQNAEDVIGKSWYMAGRDPEEQYGKIIGVMKDFHFQSLHEEIAPLTLFISESWIEYVSIRFDERAYSSINADVEKLWNKMFPNVQYYHSFLDDQLSGLYNEERSLQTVLIVFTVLAVIIGCLGLFGLVTFTAQKKTKEIGIRKVHGASTGNLVFLLVKIFSIWVIVSNIIAWPIAWYFMDEWLAGFPYRINQSIIVYLLAGLSALVIAVITVGLQAFRASQAKPVETLKYE